MKNSCTACKGTGLGPLYWFPVNTKVVWANGEPARCGYCSGSGKRKEQVFNWMKEDNPEKYIRKAKR